MSLAQTGWIVSGLFIAFMVFDAVIKLPPLAMVTNALRDIDWPNDKATARWLGAMSLIFTALYAFPNTALLGAVLLTGYLGGAVATHVRRGKAAPLFSHKLFGVYLGALLWGGLWLRSEEVRIAFGLFQIPS